MSPAPCLFGLHSKVKLNPIEMGLAYTKDKGNDLCRYQQTVNLYYMHFKCFTLTIVSSNLLPTPTAVSTQSKRAQWCNSHFIHCTRSKVGDGVWGCIRARHWASGVRGGSPSPVLHRVTSDHLTRPQYSFAPSDSDLACFIHRYHWHSSRRRLRCICWTKWWELWRIPYFVSPNSNTPAISHYMQEKLAQIFSYTNQIIPITVLAICSSMWSSEALGMTVSLYCMTFAVHSLL